VRTLWTPQTKLQAAAILGRVHTLDGHELSKPLRSLVRASDPREFRTTCGQAPKATHRTLVHGDYFSVNILPAAGGIRNIDWETFGWRDPMWELGFLIGADRDLQQDEVEAVIAEYQRHAPVHRECLTWHQRHWADFWRTR